LITGLFVAGAIVRVRGRVLIDEAAYFRWIDSLQTDRRPADVPKQQANPKQAKPKNLKRIRRV